MGQNSTILFLRYRNYINDITVKRLNSVMILSIFLFFLLMYSDLFIRDSLAAFYSRIPSFLVALTLLTLNNLKGKKRYHLTGLYNIFLASIPAMMFAKFIIHLNTDIPLTNVLGIITAICIVSLEIRANLTNTILIFILPPLLFLLVLFTFFSVSNEGYQSLINVLLILVAGFAINRIQHNFRFKAFKANNLLRIEKAKLEHSNRELKLYHNKLAELVEKKTITLQYALNKAKESDDLKSSFLQNISHEIRTPLNAAMGFIQIISEKDEDLKKESQIIIENFDVLLKLIDDIILLSKLQSKQIELIKIEFNVIDCINEIFTGLKDEIHKSSKKIKAILDYNKNDDLTIKADRKLFKKAISYIINNSVKFSSKGEIKVTCIKKDKVIILSITDTGQGIAEKDLPDIYDPFTKFEDDNSVFRGIGIGMSIAKGIIDLHSCTIDVNSEKGKGTSVIIEIM